MEHTACWCCVCVRVERNSEREREREKQSVELYVCGVCWASFPGCVQRYRLFHIMFIYKKTLNCLYWCVAMGSIDHKHNMAITVHRSFRPDVYVYICIRGIESLGKHCASAGKCRHSVRVCVYLNRVRSVAFSRFFMYIYNST